MSPDTQRRSSVLLGLFITVGLGLFVVGLFSVGTLRDLATPRVRVSTTFQEVGGLTRGAAVWYSGVEVGTVRSVTLTDSGEVRVGMALLADHVAAIPTDVSAQIGSDGLIGNTIVTLRGGAMSTRVSDGAVLDSVAAVGTAELLEDVQRTNDNLIAITDDLRAVTSTLRSGEGSLARLLEDEALYPNLVATLDNLGAASGDARRTAASTARFAAGLDDPSSLPGQIMKDSTTWENVTGAVDTLSAAAGSLNTATEGLTSRDTPIGVLLNDEASGTDVKASLESLERSAVLLEEDLEAVQHNFLLRRYFKKQEKAEQKQKEREAE